MATSSRRNFARRIVAAASIALSAALTVGVAPQASAQSSSSSPFPAISPTAPPSITKPGTAGKSVSLYSLRDSGTATKGPVTIGGKDYANSWSFSHSSNVHIELGGEYKTLKAMVGIEDGHDAVTWAQVSIKRDHVIKRQLFKISREHPTRVIDIDVTGVEKIEISSRVFYDFDMDTPRTVGLADPVVYK